MIENIQLRKVATYASTTEELADLAEINFIYGSNGTGKTTISRVIADSAAYPDCSVGWRSNVEIDKLVYNRDFIEKNFSQPSELKGIFTLGEKDKNTLEKIEEAKSQRDSIQATINQLRVTLEGEFGDGGKIKELIELESEFESRTWELKQKFDDKFQGVFKGSRGSKSTFKSKLLAESLSNSSLSVSLADLERRAETVYGKSPQPIPILTVPDMADLITHEENVILSKKVIGKSDVDIASLIQKLENSDWVKQGYQYYDPKERICPFCQQNTPTSLEHSLNEYFDETFEADSAAIEKLYTDYKNDAERLQQCIQSLIDMPQQFLDSEKLQSKSSLLDSIVRINIQRIIEKRRESSKSIKLESLKNVCGAMEDLIESANTDIFEHNAMVSNLETERIELVGQVWRFLLDEEIKSDLESYTNRKIGIEKGIGSIRTKIGNEEDELQSKLREIQSLEKDTTSIQPTIDGINNLLKSFGFTGFALAMSDRDRFYKIQRPDGSDAKETLSEGEKSFIAFLYFYHLLKGSESESGISSDRVVVFDDPVSSLDSDILFIVSNLIKGLFEEIRSNVGTIKQIFVMTHNVYFHKEVSFHPKRCAEGRLADESFWTIKKSNEGSKVQRHESNPIKTSYELLWIEVRSPDRNNLAIQNTLRRIIENYFKILGNFDPDDICAHFDGKDKLICRSLFSWVNDGSHFAQDSIYVSIDDSMVEKYLNVFREIFVRTKHIAHYEMMMGIQNGSETSATAGEVD